VTFRSGFRKKAFFSPKKKKKKKKKLGLKNIYLGASLQRY
jgi:hypothetical protein